MMSFSSEAAKSVRFWFVQQRRNSDARITLEYETSLTSGRPRNTISSRGAHNSVGPERPMMSKRENY